jgi:NAD(P)-dependent dehydrogenase (short-subunit alcohol dehydrogenase family)
MRGTTGIVTGGSSGLGLAMVRSLAAAGARVHAFSRTGKPRSGGTPRNVTHHKVNVTDSEALKKTVRQIGRTEGLDFVVNNAGITVKAPLAKGSAEDWSRIQSVNVTAGAELARLAYPFLKRSKHPGRLLFVSSMAAHLGFNGVVPYCVSKSAVLGLMRGLAVEWADDGILVNSVAPGWFPSEMSQKVLDVERRKKILARMPLHRFGKPEEPAAVVVFLLSPAASYITGHDLAVDGGALAFGF